MAEHRPTDSQITHVHSRRFCATSTSYHVQMVRGWSSWCYIQSFVAFETSLQLNTDEVGLDLRSRVSHHWSFVISFQIVFVFSTSIMHLSCLPSGCQSEIVKQCAWNVSATKQHLVIKRLYLNHIRMTIMNQTLQVRKTFCGQERRRRFSSRGF